MKKASGGSPAVERGTAIEQCPTVQTCVILPIPVLVRLNELLARLDPSVGKVHRNELIAAIVSGGPIDGDEATALIVAHRRRTAGQTVLSKRGEIRLGERKPGVRPRS